MKKRVSDISDALKAEILSESFEEGSVISAVAKRHNLGSIGFPVVLH
jgi:transposase-like protein